MKKLISLLSLLMVCCLLCACDPGTYSIDREALNSVISVELIEYENPNQKSFTSWVPDQFDKLVSFNSGNATVLETLPAEEIPEFLDDFSETHILHTYYAYNSPKDVCLRLNYENGNFLIIWANYAEESYAGYIGEYSPDGEPLTFWGSFSALSFYKNLVDRYFDYSLEEN